MWSTTPRGVAEAARCPVWLCEADTALPRPVKDYAASAADLQQLLNLLMS